MVIYENGFSGGDVTVPPSKSAAHRALLCAALSQEDCVVSNIDESRDMEATLCGIRALGGEPFYEKEKRRVRLSRAALGMLPGGEIDCLESGSTLRFLIPIAAALGGNWRFTGSARLPKRPLGIYEELLPAHGVAFRTEDGLPQGTYLPMRISGRLAPGSFLLPGNVSSQFVTGLMFALPLLEGDSEIVLTSPLESEGYVNLTLSVLKDYGIQIEKTEKGWHIPGRQAYRARNYTVEGDWSQAAFFLSMAALSPQGEKVRLHGLDPFSVQGDKACIECFERFGLKTAWERDVLTAWNPRAKEPFGGLNGYVIDAAQIPDMVPALAVCAALSQGETKIIHAGRLRLKECDRLAAMEEAVNALGGHASSTADTLTLQGVPRFQGGTVLGQNDHRIVMAIAAGALKCRGQIRVTDEHSIRKSYPNFLEDYKKLGGIAHVVNLG